ncbi:hypothetical protein HZS91_02660 [Xanthomonas citri pv. citri]|nr:hypothetical protein HZS91_02660 [Xanthomonas citri pv. citri]
MGWELMHLFSYQDGRGYGDQISSELRLCDVCRVGDALTYTYDFGDNWQHRVTVEKTMARPKGTYPRVIAWVIPPPISRRQKWNFLVPFPEEVP